MGFRAQAYQHRSHLDKNTKELMRMADELDEVLSLSVSILSPN